MNLYVSNLSFNATEEDLKQLFGQYGSISSAKIINDRETGRSRGFAFVEMGDDEMGNKAIEGLNGSEVKGRSISVAVARQKERSGGRGNW